MEGTIVNAIAILLGSLLGSGLHARLPKNIVALSLQGTGLFVLLLSSIAFSQEARIWTNQDPYFVEGDYVTINISLPEQKFSSCELVLVDPSGNEKATGSGGCGAGVREVTNLGWGDSPRDVYFPTAEFTVFAASAYEYLGEKFGTWKAKVIVKKDGQVWDTLETTFDYRYATVISGYCELENQSTTTCTFLGQPFAVSRGGGCGSEPKEINISYFGGFRSLMIKQADKVYLGDLITVRNMGSPCAADVLNLRFDKAIPPQETNVFVQPSGVKLTYGGKTDEFVLPAIAGQRQEVVAARVESEGRQAKITIDSGGPGGSLVLDSGGKEVQTSAPISVEGAELYVWSNGRKFKVNTLPDSAVAKAMDKLDSVEKIELMPFSAIYLVSGQKDGKNAQVEVDAVTGEVKSDSPAAYNATTAAPAEPQKGICGSTLLIGLMLVASFVGSSKV